MAVTAWGKPTIFVQKIGEETWKKIDTPKEDTTQVNPTKGDTQEATEEGGGVVDKKTKKSTYELSYQLFVKKGVAQPFKTIDGIIEGNYRVAVQPEDPEIAGVYMGKTTISAEEAFTSADGALITYTHSALIPEGDKVAATKNLKGQTIYCQYRWRIIEATEETSKPGEYKLVFKHPYGEGEGETITE